MSGQAGIVVVGESKLEDAIKHAVTRAEKQTAKQLDVSPKDVNRIPQEAVRATPTAARAAMPTRRRCGWLSRPCSCTPCR
jgi:hypothetical protein